MSRSNLVTPSVTVIMPIHGATTWLVEALESVKNQSFKNWHFVGCLDGPNPDAANLISSFGEKFSFIQADTTIGAAEARNRLIRQASSRYIASLDYDDIWPENHLEKTLRLLEASEDLVLVGTGARYVDSDGHFLQKTWRAPVLFLKFQLLFRNCFVHSSVVFCRDASVQAGLYDPEMTRAYDHDLWLRLAQVGRISNLRKASISYRRHPGQQSLRPLSQAFSKKILISKKNLSQSIGVPLWTTHFVHWVWERRNVLNKRLTTS